MNPIKQFDHLPDDAVVPRRVTAAGNRVGDIRAIVRGDTPPEAV
jgi:hypothetical protein